MLWPVRKAVTVRKQGHVLTCSVGGVAWAAMDPSLVAYLEDVLARARRGEVVCFVGSACAVEAVGSPSEARYELKTLVGVSLPPERAGRVQAADLRSTFAMCCEGLARATPALGEGVEHEISSRDPMYARPARKPPPTAH